MEKVFTLRNQLSELTKLSDELKELKDLWNLSNKFLLEINLILDELVTNIIEHGEQQKEYDIWVKIKNDKDKIIIEVKDEGPPFDPTKCSMPDTTLELDKRKCGGLGVLFVHKLSDSCCYRRCNDTNIFTLIKNLPPEGR